MALEDDIINLVTQTTTLNGSVDTLLKSVESRFELLRRSIPYDFIVSSRLPETSESSATIAGIQQKISAKRTSEPTGADPLLFPKPVTVYVDGRPQDSLPLALNIPNVEFVFSYGSIFNLNPGQTVFQVTADNVTIRGGRYFYSAAGVEPVVNVLIITEKRFRTILRGVTMRFARLNSIQQTLSVGYSQDNINYTE